MDQGAQSGGGGHAAGDGAKGVEEVDLQHVLGEEEADDHGQQGDDCTVDQIQGVKDFQKSLSAGDTCTDEEEHEAQFPQDLQGLGGGHDGNLAYVSKVTESQRDQQTAAGGGQGESADLHAAQQDAETGSQSEGHEVEVVHFHEAFRQSPGGTGGLGDQFPFLGHVGLEELGHELDKQHHADNAENVSDAVAHGHQRLHFRTGCSLGGGEGGSGGQSTGQQTGENGGQFAGGAGGELGIQCQTTHAHGTTDDDDDGTQQDVGSKVFLEVCHEVGAGDEAHGGDEQNKTQIFHDFQSVGGIQTDLDHLGIQILIEDAAEDQSDEKHTGGAEVDTLNGDAAQSVANSGDGKDAEHQEGDAGNRKCHTGFLLIYFLPKGIIVPKNPAVNHKKKQKEDCGAVLFCFFSRFSYQRESCRPQRRPCSRRRCWCLPGACPDW